ncbi:MAG: MgtC/SapB family protein [Bacteroidales bacterium]|nr:MgtC/SapB family protein [Bacteroidales bacterium]
MESVFEIFNSDDITTLNTIFKLVLSLILGSCIGYERKRKGQIAGVRTFSLISMGATLSMVLSIYVPQLVGHGDPTRIAAQVVSGIGFLGAGAIIQMKGAVRGLTTAAGIWMTAAVGMAVGASMYIVSIVAMFLILFILLQLERIEHRISLGSESRIIRIEVKQIVDDIQPYRDLLAQNHVSLINYYMAYDYEAGITRLNLMILAKETVNFVALFEEIHKIFPTTSLSLANQANI